MRASERFRAVEWKKVLSTTHRESSASVPLAIYAGHRPGPLGLAERLASEAHSLIDKGQRP